MPREDGLVVLLAALAGTVACESAPASVRAREAAAELPSAPLASASAAPLEFVDAEAYPPLDGSAFVDLPVGGFRDAVVSVPLGATAPRPVVVAAHGQGDRPDWQCVEMRRLVSARAFVLCPRGIVSNSFSTPGDTRYAWSSKELLSKEIDAGLVALRAKYTKHVDAGPMLYVGFSFGASAGVAIVAGDAARFPMVILTEGGGDSWTSDRARAFATKGGRKVLFACGQPSCRYTAKQIAPVIAKTGVGVKVVYGEGEGHGYGGAVAAQIQGELAWLTAGDARWEAP